MAAGCKKKIDPKPADKRKHPEIPGIRDAKYERRINNKSLFPENNWPCISAWRCGLQVLLIAQPCGFE
jgi:hypothetical protein